MTITTDFPGTTLPAGWTFDNNPEDSASFQVADGMVTIIHPVGTNADGISNTTGGDKTAGIRHDVVGGTDWDIAVCYASDPAGDGSSETGFHIVGNNGTQEIRFTPYGTASRVSTYGYERYEGVGATFHHANPNDTWFYGTPAWWRAKRVGSLYTFYGSGDGNNWIEVGSVTSSVNARTIKMVAGQYGAMLGRPTRITEVVDLVAAGSTDVRPAVPSLVQVDTRLTNFSTMPSWLTTESLGDALAQHEPGQVSLQTAPLDGSSARLTYNATGIDDCAGMLALVKMGTVHSSCYAAIGLGVQDVGGNIDMYSASPLAGGLEIQLDPTMKALTIRVKRPTSIDEFNEPYTFIDARTVGNGEPLTPGASDGTWLRIERHFDRLRIRVWDVSVPEPATWFYDGVDPQILAGPGKLAPYFAVSHNDTYVGWGELLIQGLSFYKLQEGVDVPSLDNVWDGSRWISAQTRVWDGTTWVSRVMQQWNGSSWVGSASYPSAVYSAAYSRSAMIDYTATNNDWKSHLTSKSTEIAAIASGLNQHDYGFGISTHAWSSANETGPNTYDWTALDSRLTALAAAGLPITITVLGSALRHRDGAKDAGTWPLDNYDDTDPFTYSPPTMNYWNSYAQYVAALVRRYDGVNHPVNISRISFGNELKGWWSNTLPFRTTTGRYWIEGYVQLYNLCQAAAKAARPDNDPQGAVEWGGPYPVMETLGNTQSYKYDNHVTQPGWDISTSSGQRYNQDRLDALEYFMRNAVGYDFITLDTKNHNTWDDGVCPDPLRTTRNAHGLKMEELEGGIRALEQEVGFRNGMAAVPNPAPIGIAEYYTQDNYPDWNNPGQRLNMFQDSIGVSITVEQKTALLFWTLMDVTHRVSLEYIALWQFMDLPPTSQWPVNPWTEQLVNQVVLQDALAWWKTHVANRADVQTVTIPGEPDLLGIAGNGETMMINYSSVTVYYDDNGTTKSITPWTINTYTTP